MRFKAYRFCMLVGAAALIAVALYYFGRYAVVLSVALDNSGLGTSLLASIRALWLAFAFQALLIGLMYALVAFRPQAVSREVIVLLGLLQLVEAGLLFVFAGSLVMGLLLVAVAVCVMVGAVLWPSEEMLAAQASVPAPAPAVAAEAEAATPDPEEPR